MSHRKRVRTIESFFAPNRSQTESEKNDTEEEQCINQEETDEDQRKPKKSRTFQKTWLRDHIWLRYEKEAMFCYFCRKSKKTNPFASAEGCTNFRTSTLQRHKDCKEHEDAVNEEAMRDTFSNTQRRVFREQSQAILTAMRAVYWLAKEDIATVKYDSLLNFLDEVGLESVKNLRVGGNATYRSHQSAEGMQDAIATVLKSNIDKLVEASPFFSLLIDESTDVSNHENLVVYVKLLNEFKPELHFLENINVRDGKAETITTAVNLLMERRNLHKDKMTGFGSDGASVMTGKNNGVSKRMKDDSPFLLSIHCMAHRLALCTSQAANGIPYLAKFKEILTALYRYFDKSALRSQTLSEFQKIFEHPELKIKEVFDIRWFSFYGALETLNRTWQSLVAYMESRPNSDDKARGFKKSLKEFNFVATLCMMMDVIPVLTFMSLALQKEHVELASVQAMVKSTVTQITTLKSNNGKFLSEILPSQDDVSEVKWRENTIKVTAREVQQFESMKLKFLDNVLLNLEKRFPVDATNVVNAFGILSLRNVRF